VNLRFHPFENPCRVCAGPLYQGKLAVHPNPMESRFLGFKLGVGKNQFRHENPILPNPQYAGARQAFAIPCNESPGGRAVRFDDRRDHLGADARDRLELEGGAVDERTRHLISARKRLSKNALIDPPPPTPMNNYPINLCFAREVLQYLPSGC
jgi:hypothetical protein